MVGELDAGSPYVQVDDEGAGNVLKGNAHVPPTLPQPWLFLRMPYD